MSAVSQRRLAVALGAALSLGAALLGARSCREREAAGDAAGPRETRGLRAGGGLEAQERAVAETLWAQEMLAEECGRTFESLWDSLNAATNKLALLARFPVGRVLLPRWSPARVVLPGLVARAPAGPGLSLQGSAWSAFVEGFGRAGWRLAQCEFRHNRFDTDAAGQPRQSTYYLAANLANASRGQRAALQGDLLVDWRPAAAAAEATVEQIDATHLALRTCEGPPWFEPVLAAEITPRDKAYFIDPLILYDLDGDGLSEIILAVQNVVYRRQPDGHYEPGPLCRHPPGLIFTGLIADFDGDGHADFLCARADGLLLFKGSPSGTFDEPERLVWKATQPLKNPLVMTCGDLDQDGGLDVFLGQYRVPLLGQVLRPHYYDANDGHPAHLLHNDGRGNFTDTTFAAGLGDKRARRVYSASFVHLDDDQHLDLLVVSDFAGLDLYRNDGRGRFTDVTDQWVAESHAFGMAQTIADFNGDGRLDFLMIGMNSPAADRLEHLGLTRAAPGEDSGMRRRMSFGNRLYLARPGGGFAPGRLGAAIARTGWSWGCAAFDFDNDGFADLYVANGHQSKRTVRDYDPEFWLHDIYVDESVSDVEASAYFMAKFAETRGRGWSYGGYELNRLYLNQGGEDFLELGHLAGVALQQDSRNAMADDLDGDGRPDLVVTTLEVWPEARQTLRAYRNTLQNSNHWIGFRLREQGAGISPVGARVTVHAAGRTAVGELVAGEGYRSQRATTLHFGVGAATNVESVEVRWMSGATLTLREPSVDRYHAVQPPAAR